MVEKIDQMVSAQVEAIRNLKIDSITVWDSGGDGDGSSTSNFISNLVKSRGLWMKGLLKELQCADIGVSQS